MDNNLSRWARRCAICGALLSPLAVHQAGIPSDCKCLPRHAVEQQAGTPPEQPDSWPEVQQVLPQQSSAQSNRFVATYTVPYESLQGVSFASTTTG